MHNMLQQQQPGTLTILLSVLEPPVFNGNHSVEARHLHCCINGYGGVCVCVCCAGTYIFTLNDEEQVDATRAGNMAHLINHSCAPNGHSRILTVRDPATRRQQDHVIIIASRDILAGEQKGFRAPLTLCLNLLTL